MNKLWLGKVFLAVIALLGAVSYGYAGSERLIMSMSAKNMDQEDLVYVRFIGPDGNALESRVLQKMVIKEQDCNSGHALKIVLDYKIGYAPVNMLVGIYLYPKAWNNKNLCFTIPGMGKVEKILNPTANKGRMFQLNVAQ